MPQRPIIVEPFRDLPGVAEIVGIGGIRQPRGEAQEVEVAVILASDLDAPNFNPATDAHERWVGCGQLDLLVPGTRWKRGRREPTAARKLFSGRYELFGYEPLGDGSDPPSGVQRFPSRRIAASKGFLISRVPDPVAGPVLPKRKEVFLLPHIELVRAMFGVSNGFLLEVFDGLRNVEVNGDRGIVMRARSGVRPDGTVVIAANRKLSREEALMTAAIIADDDIRKFNDLVHQQLSTDRDWGEGLAVLVDATWPWRVPVAMSFEGRWIERADGKRRFVIDRLVAIEIPFTFSRVLVEYPGFAETDINFPPPSGRMRQANAREMVLTTGRAASPSRRSAEVATGLTDFPSAREIEVVYHPRDGTGRSDRGGIGENARGEAPFGTGGRQLGADVDVGAAILRRKRFSADEIVRNHKDALTKTWRALVAACALGGWHLHALPRTRAGVVDLPDGGFQFPKEPLVAMVSIGAQHVVIVDRGSVSGDERSLGILIPLYDMASDTALGHAARRECEAYDGRWRRAVKKKAKVFKIHAANRSPDVWNNEDRYRDMLLRRLASIVRADAS